MVVQGNPVQANERVILHFGIRTNILNIINIWEALKASAPNIIQKPV